LCTCVLTKATFLRCFLTKCHLIKLQICSNEYLVMHDVSLKLVCAQKPSKSEFSKPLCSSCQDCVINSGFSCHTLNKTVHIASYTQLLFCHWVPIGTRNCVDCLDAVASCLTFLAGGSMNEGEGRLFFDAVSVSLLTFSITLCFISTMCHFSSPLPSYSNHRSHFDHLNVSCIMEGMYCSPLYSLNSAIRGFL